MDLAEPQDGRQRPPSPADQRRRRLRHAVPIVLVMLALAAAAVLSGREENVRVGDHVLVEPPLLAKMVMEIDAPSRHLMR